MRKRFLCLDVPRTVLQIDAIFDWHISSCITISSVAVLFFKVLLCVNRAEKLLRVFKRSLYLRESVEISIVLWFEKSLSFECYSIYFQYCWTILSFILIHINFSRSPQYVFHRGTNLTCLLKYIKEYRICRFVERIFEREYANIYIHIHA